MVELAGCLAKVRCGSRVTTAMSSTLNYQELLKQRKIQNLIENQDYLLVIASQQQKLVQQVKYELKLKLREG